LAQVHNAIVAVVNDEAISTRDVENRIALFLVTGNIEDRPEIRARLAPEVLSMLIDDTLKRQEARRLDIVVNADEIDRALSRVAAQLRVPPERLGELLSGRGVALSTLREQIETDIAWVKVVNRLSGNAVTVADDEIDDEIERMHDASGQPEFRVGEIFLPVDRPADEAAVRDLAGRLVDELRAGASFAGIARIFSKGPAADVGGDLGWIRPGQLDPELERILLNMQPGQLAGPIRTSRGYHALALFGRRIAGMPSGEVRLRLAQVFAPVPETAGSDQVDERAGVVIEVARDARTCETLVEGARGKPGLVAGPLGTTKLGELPPQLRDVVAPLREGDKTRPMRTIDGIAVVMVCSRQEEAVDQEIREAIRRFLREERLSAASQRILRDLRRGATVDRRE
jgi:peptidyl-prolyl cis-trans isomerase SurA